MAQPAQRDLGDYLADDLHDQADELTEAWMRWIVDTISLRPARMLPREAIRNHIPKVLRGVADSLRGPAETIGVAAGAARGHARLRRDQGYDIEELLKEYGGLSRIAGEHLVQALERYPGSTDPLEVAKIFRRFSEGLGEVTELTTGLYRATEVRHKRELHRQLEDFVETVTHELRQPLQSITAGSDMLGVDAVATKEKKRDRYLGMIRQGLDRASLLIDEIRMLVLFEGAQQHEDWQPLDSVMNLMLREMEEHAMAQDVHIEVVQPVPDIDVQGTRAEIALVNLVSNAIKYSDPDKPERWVRIEAERHEPEEAYRWEVRVADNGLGVPNDMQAHIFERHVRAHPNVAEGTGLGLAITRRLVEQGGGDVWFESEPGEGSVFHFLLPGRPNEGAPDRPNR